MNLDFLKGVLCTSAFICWVSLFFPLLIDIFDEKTGCDVSLRVRLRCLQARFMSVLNDRVDNPLISAAEIKSELQSFADRCDVFFVRLPGYTGCAEFSLALLRAIHRKKRFFLYEEYETVREEIREALSNFSLTKKDWEELQQRCRDIDGRIRTAIKGELPFGFQFLEPFVGQVIADRYRS